MNHDELIALIRHEGAWHYYHAMPDDWVLDLPAYENAFIERGYSVPPSDVNDRFGIRQGDVDFLEELRKKMV